MEATITAERPDTADARALIDELEAHLATLYPRESRHGYSVEKLIAQGVAFFLVRDNGTPVGCVGIQLFGTDYGELKRMYVRPQFRGLSTSPATAFIACKAEWTGFIRPLGSPVKAQSVACQFVASRPRRRCWATRKVIFLRRRMSPIWRTFEVGLVLRCRHTCVTRNVHRIDAIPQEIESRTSLSWCPLPPAKSKRRRRSRLPIGSRLS